MLLIVKDDNLLPKIDAREQLNPQQKVVHKPPQGFPPLPNKDPSFLLQTQRFPIMPAPNLLPSQANLPNPIVPIMIFQ
jgi:hypothetical protein